jgi:membrane associated rhomboid family serine protease
VVKRGTSYGSESLSEISNKEIPGVFGQTVSKTASILGIGTFALSVLKNYEYPLHFYAICLAFSFLIYLGAQFLISKVTKDSKLKNVIGCSSFCGSGGTYFSAFAIFSALITMSSICFSLSIQFIIHILHIFSFRVHVLVVSLVFGILSFLIIMFISKREVVYFSARCILATMFITLIIFNFFLNCDSILEEASTNLKIPIQISLSGLKEFSTVVGITLLSLFSRSICNPSILTKKIINYSSTDYYTKRFLSDLFSSIIGFICYNIIFVSSKGAFVSGFFTDNIFANVIFRVFFCILLIATILIQSFEYFDRAHILITVFFMPLSQDKMKSLRNLSFRKTILIVLMFSISYYFYEFDLELKTYCNAMSYVFSLALSIPFLIMPSYVMIRKNFKESGSFSFPNFVAYFTTGITGTILSIFCILGLNSIQNSKIFMMMMENFKFFILSFITSVFIYALGLICDAYFYPPKSSPTDHRSINLYESPEYGNSYAVEIFILAFIFSTFSPPVQSFLYLSSESFFESSVLFIGKCILRIFIHENTLHLLLNCLFLYKVGKRLSAEIGSFHFISFFFSAGLLSEIIDQVFMTHSYISSSYSGLGASGINFALLSRYYFEEGSIFQLFFFPVTGCEFMIFSIFSDIFFHLTMLLPSIAHSAHFAGAVFGIFFWKYSDKIWRLRHFISKKIQKNKK